ncbi:MAG: right-handed parallel beta-helix repeat-containing protein [Candidatus Thorarchaeota archaeon]
MKPQTIGLVLALVWILVIATPAAHEEEGLEIERSPVQESMYLSNEVHGPIFITNTSQFYDQAVAEDWPGDGSQGNPYRIEYYNITTDSLGIYLVNVSYYIKIQSCNIEAVGLASPGIYTNNVTHCEIRDTTVSGFSFGLYIDHDSDVLISGCTVSDSDTRGIFFQSTGDCRVENSEVYGCQTGIWGQATNSIEIINTDSHDNLWDGIYLVGCDFCAISGGSFYDNDGTGMYIYDSQNCTIESTDVYGNQDVTTGIHIYLSDNVTITRNSVHDNLHVGILLDNSDIGFIQDNDVWNNSDVGIQISKSDNCSVSNNDVWENGLWQAYFPTSGISFETSWYSSIIGNRVWNNSFSGIRMYNEADRNEIIGNQIWNNTDYGVYANDALNIDFVDNDIYGNGWNASNTVAGIYIVNSLEWQIEDNRIWSNTDDGIFLSLYGAAEVLNSEIYDNSRHGVNCGGGGPFIVDGNTIHSNDDTGVYSYPDDYANVTNNIVYDNAVGIYMNQVDGWIYGNDIGWNSVANAVDIGDNYWHDNVSVGNHWSDYSGVGNYNISGYYDIYPKKSLDLNESTAIDFEITETGNTMFWGAYALNPSHYEVYANDSLLYDEEWDGDQIETTLDGLLDAGAYDIMVIAYHVSGHSLNATAIAEVTDTTGPVWVTAPSNQEITAGDPFSYQVTATDPSGIEGYSVNDTTNFQISTSGLITNPVDLQVGVYGLEIIAVDPFGNDVTATITITVVAATPTGDGTTMLLLAAGAGGVVLLVVVVIFMKKRE